MGEKGEESICRRLVYLCGLEVWNSKFKFKNTLLSLQRNLPVVPQDNRKQHIL